MSYQSKAIIVPMCAIYVIIYTAYLDIKTRRKNNTLYHKTYVDYARSFRILIINEYKYQIRFNIIFFIIAIVSCIVVISNFDVLNADTHALSVLVRNTLRL